MDYETTPEIEIAVAKSFGVRKYLIVPNVSWGLLPYEADLLILTSSAYLWEVEIKVSRHDLLRDRNKNHGHNSEKVRRLWFAIPEKLESCIEYVPERAGVLVIGKSGGIIERRPPMLNAHSRKLSDEECFQFARLGALRIWGLKQKIESLKSNGQ